MSSDSAHAAIARMFALVAAVAAVLLVPVVAPGLGQSAEFRDLVAQPGEQQVGRARAPNLR